MARKNFKKKQVDTSVGVFKGHLEEMKPSGHCNTFILAAFVLVVAVCVVPLAALSNSHLSNQKRTALAMDKASLTVKNELDTDMMVSWVSDHCYKCLYQQLGFVPAAPSPGQPSSTDLLVDTQHGLTLQLNHTPDNLCTLPFHFGEHGNYSLWIKKMNNSSVVSCSIVTLADPINSYIPILVAFLIYTGLALVSAIGNTLHRLDVVKNFFFRMRGTMDTERLINSELGPPGRNTMLVTDNIHPLPPTSSKRLQSLDTFRGISLVIMVFVNYGGGRYWFFRHESWNGLTVADLVFPWFMFIMGTSIALSVHSLLRTGSTRLSQLRKVACRSLQLFIIGLLIINPNYCQGPLSWDSLRIPGVLQRLALAYLVVACLDLLVARSHLDVYTTDAWWSQGIDILLYWPAWVCVFLLESIWLFVTFLLPVPNCPTGYLGPGGIGDMGLYPNCTGGAAGFIDRWLLGERHIYQNPSSRTASAMFLCAWVFTMLLLFFIQEGIYATHLPYDPEGILGSINSILMAFLGLQAGKIILHHRDHHQGVISRFLIWSLILGIISAVLTNCSTNQGLIPINKNLWSLSYVTTLACCAFVLLALMYYTVDVKKWWSGKPFFYPGMNSILVYVGHEVFKEYFPFRWQMSNSQSHTEHLTQNLVATSCWVFISYVLYRKKIFFKI